MRICFGRKDGSIHGYANADFAGNVDNRRSMTRYCFTFTRGAILWVSRLKPCTTLSCIEVEYVDMKDLCDASHILGIRIVKDRRKKEISSKSMPFSCLNPLATNHALYLGNASIGDIFNLYIHLHVNACLPYGNLSKSQVSFIVRKSIYDCMAFSHLCLSSLDIATT